MAELAFQSIDRLGQLLGRRSGLARRIHRPPGALEGSAWARNNVLVGVAGSNRDGTARLQVDQSLATLSKRRWQVKFPGGYVDCRFAVSVGIRIADAQPMART
jgi:hypothetical protein